MEQWSAAYGVSLRVLAAIYVLSAVPIWGGAAIMLAGSGILKGLASFPATFRECDFRNGVVIAGAVIHLLGWLSPYLYLEIAGRNLPWFVHAVVTLFLGLGGAALCG
jgi:hypothetical protein